MFTALAIGTINLGSNSDLGLGIATGLIFSFWGYTISKRHRIARGVTPWRLPSFAWAIICLFLQPFGIIVELFAEFTTRPAMPTVNGDVASQYPTFPPPNPTAASQQLATATVEPVAKYPAPNDGSDKPALFGWYDDPLKRHGHRYWDGRFWTDQVADNGTISSDPLP